MCCPFPFSGPLKIKFVAAGCLAQMFSLLRARATCDFSQQAQFTGAPVLGQLPDGHSHVRACLRVARSVQDPTRGQRPFCWTVAPTGHRCRALAGGSPEGAARPPLHWVPPRSAVESGVRGSDRPPGVTWLGVSQQPARGLTAPPCPPPDCLSSGPAEEPTGLLKWEESKRN